MQPFEGYKGISPEERYRNEMIDHARKQTELLEQIAQLLQRKGEGLNELHPTEGVPIDGTGKSKPRQRSSNGTRGRRKQ